MSSPEPSTVAAPDQRFARPAGEDALCRAAAALTANGLAAEILDDVEAARARVRELVPETGSLLAASATGSQIPAYGGGAARRIWIAGAQKVVPDLDAALRRLDAYALPLEDARARAAYGVPTAANEVLVVNGEPVPGRSLVLLLRETIGY